MCRIAGMKAINPQHPRVMLKMMEAMQKGHDNSGFALVMQDLYGIFEPYKKYPMMSLAVTDKGLDIVKEYMKKEGWKEVWMYEPEYHYRQGLKIELMPRYVYPVYDWPEEAKDMTQEEREELLVDTRLTLRKILEDANEGYIYSFWPDVLTLKEIGDPRHIGEYFGLWEEDDKFVAKILTAQARQNTNYDIVRYAAHPFFLQGYTALANGENTFYQKNKDYLKNLYKGYIGFESDSQCFLYTLHYVHKRLKLPLIYFKHVITPLPVEEIEKRENKDTLLYLRASLSHLEINGPNTIIGVLPDGTMFSTHDAKKLRPVVVGGTKERMFIASEVVGLNAVCPERDWTKDIYTHEREMVIIDNNLEVHRWQQ